MLKKKKTYVILIIILLIIGGVYRAKTKKAVSQYTTADVVKGNLVRTVSVTGKVQSPTEIDLAFKSAGTLKSINVDVSDKVTAGQKLAEIDRGTLNADLAQAQENIQAQQKTLIGMRNNPSMYNAAQLDSQRSEIKKAQAAYDAILTQIQDTSLKAPIDGTIIKRNYDPGELISLGSPVLTLASVGDLEIDANVPESDIVKVQVGQHANLTFDAFSTNDNFSGIVEEIDPASTVIQDVVYYKVKLKLDNPEPRLKNGMSSDIDINTAEKDNVVYGPLRAVKTDGGGKYVEVLKDEKQGITEKVPVTTGLEGDDGMVEITSGLKGGEKVVTLTKAQ